MEHLDLFPVLFQPTSDLLTMMGTKMIQNQKNFLTGIFGQSSHKLDQKLGIHGISIHQKTLFAAAGDRRNYTDVASLSNQSHHRHLSFRCEAPDPVGTCLNPRLITPVNPRLLAREAMAG